MPDPLSTLPTPPIHPLRLQHRAAATLAGLALAIIATAPATAQVFKDPALNALYEAERFSDLDQLAQKRAATRADDAQAVLGIAFAAMIGNDGGKREAAIRRAEACLQAAPLAAPCHYALGSVLGIHALHKGMLKALGSVGRVKDALSKAVELEPAWYTARSALVQLYLSLPGMAGGGATRATEVARGAPRPEQARLLEARVAIKQDRFDAALTLLDEVKPGADSAVADDLQQLRVGAGIGLLGEGKRQQARQVFERLMQEHPTQAAGPYGLARVETEAGAYAEAVALLQRADRLKGADRLAIDYRLGIAEQQQGHTDAARAALQRYLAQGLGSRNSMDDAKKRLAQLGG